MMPRRTHAKYPYQEQNRSKIDFEEDKQKMNLLCSRIRLNIIALLDARNLRMTSDQ